MALSGSWDIESKVTSTLMAVISIYRYRYLIHLFVALDTESHDPLSRLRRTKQVDFDDGVAKECRFLEYHRNVVKLSRPCLLFDALTFGFGLPADCVFMMVFPWRFRDLLRFPQTLCVTNKP